MAGLLVQGLHLPILPLLRSPTVVVAIAVEALRAGEATGTVAEAVL